MVERREQWQWAMLVKVLHSSHFGHRLECETRTRGRGSHTMSLGTWRGVGVPPEVVQEAQTAVAAILSDHLVTRYGVAGALPFQWGGEADPF